MRSKTPLLVAFILFTSLFFGTFVGGLVLHTADASSPSGYSLQSVQAYNPYGQFVINETLKGTSGSTPLSSATFGFPSSYQVHLASLSSYAKLGSSPVQTTTTTSVSNNTLLITLSFAQSLSGSNSTVGLGFWVLDSLKVVNATSFIAPVLASPSVSISLTSLNSTLEFQNPSIYLSNATIVTSEGFASSTAIIQTPSYNGHVQTWNYFTNNATSKLKAFPVTIHGSSSSTGYLDFTSISRQISIDASGKILVKDTLNIRNLGLNTISVLTYIPLTTAQNLTAVPSNEPPLSNVGTVSMSGQQISLNNTNQEIQPSSSATLIFQYPLSTQYWNVSNGIYDVSVPTTVPIGGIVNLYSLSSNSIPGIVIIGHQISLSGTDTNQLGASTAAFKFRVGIASASSDALPIAVILFVGVFVGAILFRPKSEVGEDFGSAFDALIKAVEDKVSSTNDILSELKSNGSSMGRNELVVARSRIEDVRTKAISRIGSIRSQLPQSVSTAVQAGLNEVVSSDREFDRVVRDILNNYDQFVSKRMKEDTFERIQQSNGRRLQSVTNSLLDKVHDLREEFESES